MTSMSVVGSYVCLVSVISPVCVVCVCVCVCVCVLCDSLCAVELLNIQITLHGIEQSGFLIVSSNVAQIYGREHEPKVREGDLVKKTSWVSTLSDVQVRV